MLIRTSALRPKSIKIAVFVKSIQYSEMDTGIMDMTERKRLKTIPSSTKIRTKPNRLRPSLVDSNTG